LIILIFHSATETRIWIANVLQNEAGIFHVTHSCLSTTKHTDSTLFYLKCCANYLSKAVPIRWCYGIWVEIYQHTLICFANPCHSHLHSTTACPFSTTTTMMYHFVLLVLPPAAVSLPDPCHSTTHLLPHLSAAGLSAPLPVPVVLAPDLSSIFPRSPRFACRSFQDTSDPVSELFWKKKHYFGNQGTPIWNIHSTSMKLLPPKGGEGNTFTNTRYSS
jgi:hypothetical protein